MKLVISICFESGERYRVAFAWLFDRQCTLFPDYFIEKTSEFDIATWKHLVRNENRKTLNMRLNLQRISLFITILHL